MNWRSVKNQLPLKGSKVIVLVFNDYHPEGITLAVTVNDDQHSEWITLHSPRDCDCCSEINRNEVTHWMPIPPYIKPLKNASCIGKIIKKCSGVDRDNGYRLKESICKTYGIKSLYELNDDQVEQVNKAIDDYKAIEQGRIRIKILREE